MRILLMIIFIFASVFVRGQNQQDNLLDIWNDTSLPDTTRIDAVHEFININYHKIPPDSIFYLAQLQYDIAIKNGLKNYLAKALNSRGRAYSLLGDFENAIILHRRSLELCREVKCKKGILESITNLGNVFYERQDPKTAIDYYHQSVLAAKSLEDPKKVVAAYNGLATIYKEEKDNDNAKLYFTKALKINKSIADKLEVAHSLCNLAIVNAIGGDFKTAIEKFQETYEIQKELNLIRDMAESLLNIANIYYILGDDASEKKELIKSNELYTTAVEYNNKALVYAQSVGSVTEVRHASKDLMLEYYPRGQTVEPTQVHDPSIGIRKSISNIEGGRQQMSSDNSYVLTKHSAEPSHKRILNDQKSRKSAHLKWASFLLLSTGAIIYFLIHKRRAAKTASPVVGQDDIEPIITIDSMLEKGLYVNNADRPKLKKDMILAAADGNLNDSDWKILNALYESPGINNREISNKVALSIDGVRSSLRKMYRLFDIPKSQKNQRIALVVIAINISNSQEDSKE